MSRYSDEQKAASLRRARETLAQLAAEDAISRSSSMMPQTCAPEPRFTQSFGDMPLLSSEPMERWRAEADEWARKCEQERERMRKHERQILLARQAQQQTEIDEALAAVGEALGHVRQQLRDEFAEQLGQLRAEISIANAHDRGQILDLPALPLRRRGNAA